MQLAMLGLGRMGGNMAQRLLRGGHQVIVYDVDPRRATELAALVTRHGLTLACAVFRPADPLPTRAADDRVAAALRHAGRASDAIGRTGDTEFAVFAPASSTLVATRLMLRITDSIEHQLGFVAQHSGRVGIRSGCSMSYSQNRISPAALLARARSALELR